MENNKQIQELVKDIATLKEDKETSSPKEMYFLEISGVILTLFSTE